MGEEINPYRGLLMERAKSEDLEADWEVIKLKIKLKATVRPSSLCIAPNSLFIG